MLLLSQRSPWLPAGLQMRAEDDDEEEKEEERQQQQPICCSTGVTLVYVPSRAAPFVSRAATPSLDRFFRRVVGVGLLFKGRKKIGGGVEMETRARARAGGRGNSVRPPD